VLRDLSQRLDPAGSMFIEVPNASSFEMLWPSRRRSILDLPVHLYHFTPRTLPAVLAAAGLEPADVSLSNPDWLEWLFALRTNRRPKDEQNETWRPYRDRPGSAPEWSPFRAAWRQHILPELRRWSPGWKFSVLARKA